MSDASKRWATASSLDELGELTAAWLEGTLAFIPTYGDRPDPETLPLVPALAAMNRAGFWTNNSQPGEHGADGYVQRAWVCGYCNESTSNTIVAAAVATDLVVLATPAVFESWVQIPISRLGNKEWTWSGGHTPPTRDSLEDTPAAFDAVVESWYVEVIDPVWGRNDLLWPTVTAALVERPRRELIDHGQFAGSGPPPGCRLVDGGR